MSSDVTIIRALAMVISPRSGLKNFSVILLGNPYTPADVTHPPTTQPFILKKASCGDSLKIAQYAGLG
ncbi:hypothetical protein BVX99_01700 [bacterium F16]|nr:hypothetical protein BVX99_01700 [bacterium F16]